MVSDLMPWELDWSEPKGELMPWEMQWAKPERTTGEKLARAAGLTLRYGIEGPAAIPGIIANAPAALYNTGKGLINYFAGTQLPRTKLATESLSDLLTAAGVPNPETPTEEVVGAISKAFAGGATAASLAGAVPATANTILAARPLMQAAQSATGGGASEITRQLGGGSGAQLIAGALAPMAITPLAESVAAATRGVRELARPVTTGGQQQIAADVVGKLAQDKARALENLRRYNALKAGEVTGGPTVGVPGSVPTAGAVSADYGLIGAQQMLERSGENAPDFARRAAQNNAARLEDLAKLNATAEQLATYTAKREALTAPLREQAFARAKGPVNYQAVANKVGELISTPAGGRAESQRALSWIITKLDEKAAQGRTDPGNAYALHQDINDLISGKISSDQGAVRLSAGLATQVKQTLATEIDKVAPGFKLYLETYSRLSKPIDRLQAIVDRLGGQELSRVTNATPMASDAGGAYALSQAKMRNALTGLQNELPVRPQGLPLAPRQSDILNRVVGELNADALASRGGRPPGSDTYQNMATANFLTRTLGETAGKSAMARAAAKPLSWLYAPLGADRRIADLIGQAFLDPTKMEELLAAARTARPSLSIRSAIGSEVGALGRGLLGSYVR